MIIVRMALSISISSNIEPIQCQFQMFSFLNCYISTQMSLEHDSYISLYGLFLSLFLCNLDSERSLSSVTAPQQTSSHTTALYYQESEPFLTRHHIHPTPGSRDSFRRHGNSNFKLNHPLNMLPHDLELLASERLINSLISNNSAKCASSLRFNTLKLSSLNSLKSSSSCLCQG
jgi:hypothetical protein